MSEHRRSLQQSPHLKLEDSKEALRKIEGMTTEKKNDCWVGTEGQKGQDKRIGEDK